MPEELKASTSPVRVSLVKRIEERLRSNPELKVHLKVDPGNNTVRDLWVTPAGRTVIEGNGLEAFRKKVEAVIDMPPLEEHRYNRVFGFVSYDQVGYPVLVYKTDTTSEKSTVRVLVFPSTERADGLLRVGESGFPLLSRYDGMEFRTPGSVGQEA